MTAQGLSELRNIVARAKLDREDRRLAAINKLPAPRDTKRAPRPPKYATEEERHEARKRSYLKSKHRSRDAAARFRECVARAERAA